MMTLIIIVHVIACAVLITLVLIQRGRGGGLVEGFSGVESMFGTKTSAFLTRTTTICSIIFFITCLSLALLSVKKSRSLMQNVRTTTSQATQALPVAEKVPQTAPAAAQAPTTPAQETPKTQ